MTGADETRGWVGGNGGSVGGGRGRCGAGREGRGEGGDTELVLGESKLPRSIDKSDTVTASRIGKFTLWAV